MILNVDKFILCLLAVFLCQGFALADVQDDLRKAEQEKAKLQAEIKKLDRSLSETDSLLKDDARRYALLEKRYGDDISRRRAELDSLSARIRSIAEDIQRERSAAQMFNAQSANENGRRKAVRKTIERAADNLRMQVERSVPWDREARLDRVQGLVRDAKAADVTEEELFSRFLSIVADEVRFGDEVRLMNAPMVRNDGETVNARILRIGNQWIVYADENNRLFGALSRTESADSVHYEWNEELSLGDREAIRLALDVKDSKKPPQMVTLPLSVSVLAGGKKQ